MLPPAQLLPSALLVKCTTFGLRNKRSARQLPVCGTIGQLGGFKLGKAGFVVKSEFTEGFK